MKTMRKLMNCFVAVALAFAPGLALAQNGGAAADLKFTGAGAYVDRSGRNATIASPTIVEKANANTGGGYALDFSGGGTYAVTLTDSATVPSLSSSGDGWTLATWIYPTSSCYGMTKNAWNYVLITYDKGCYRAWQNGTQLKEPVCLVANYNAIGAAGSLNDTATESEIADVLGCVPFSISGMTLTLGGKLISGKYGSTATFKGYMDEVLALNRAVSQYEMVRLYHTGDPTIFTTGAGTHIDGFDTTGDTSNYQSPWSTWRAPVPGADYIIESGHKIKSSGAAGKCFAGRTLTIGRCEALLSRVDGSTVASAGKGVLALGHTGYTSFHKLVLNAGSITGIRTGLNSDLSGDSNGTGGGVVEVNAPAADPFTLTFSADTTIGGAVTGAAGTGLKFTGGKNVTFAAGALDGYAGEFDFGSCGNVTATLACDSGAPANPLKVSALASGKTVTLNFTGTLPAVEGSYAVATLPAGANFAAGTLPTVAGGEYAAWAVADDSGSGRVIKLEVGKKPMTATVTGAIGPANGTAYSCTLTVTDPADGYTALWYDGSDYTLSAAPTHTEEGVYEDSVKVTKAGYYDFYGTGVVTVAAELSSDVQLLTYIQSGGNEYIDTGVKFNSATDEVEIDFEMTDYSTTTANGIFGSRIASANENYTLQFTSQHNILFGCRASSASASYQFRWESGAVNKRYVIRISQSSRSLTDVATSQVLTSDVATSLDSFSSTKNAYLFWSNVEASWLKAKMKLYGCRIWREGDLLHDFVPCRALVDGVETVCLYDKETKGFYKNKGTGSFTAGPEQDTPEDPEDPGEDPAEDPETGEDEVGSRWRYWLGVDNVRDFGGMTTTDGRMVRTNRIYRTQAFNDNAICDWLTAARLKAKYEGYTLWYEFGRDNADELVLRFDHNNLALSYQTVAAALAADRSLWRAGAPRGTAESRAAILAETGLKTEIDLRSTSECYGMTGSPLGASVNWVNLPSDGTGAWYYSAEGKAFFKACFPYFLNEANYPIAFHCIAGADRTGCLAYILGALLGIGEPQLLEDYEMTSLSSSGARNKSSFQSSMRALTDHYSGSTLHEKMSAYAADCGFTGEDIATFRSLVLKPAKQ